VRLRTTAPPTALDTTKPTRGGRPARVSVEVAWTTSSLEPARQPPEERTADVKSARSRSRFGAGSTRASGGELGAALTATSGEDAATRTGAHPQTEAVGLGPAAVVRLESPLAHDVLSSAMVGLVGPGWSGSRWLFGCHRKPMTFAGKQHPFGCGSRACENSRTTGPLTVRESSHGGQTSGCGTPGWGKRPRIARSTARHPARHTPGDHPAYPQPVDNHVDEVAVA
jgi:hypothetical protein